MVTLKTVTPFSSAARYSTGLMSWLDEYDGQRVAAYAVWEDIYWARAEVFAETAQGTDSNPIVMPVARAMVEAINRYLAVDWDLYVDPAAGTAQEQALAAQTFSDLFKRENVYAKFGQQKRWGLVKGDAVWHVTADPLKPQGSRISMHTLDPASYYPVFDDDSMDRQVGVYVVDVVEDPKTKKQVARRQAYMRERDANGDFTGLITSELGLYDLDGWDDRNKTDFKIGLVEQLEDLATLPPQVTQLPVYRVPNGSNPGDPFGNSALRGLERIIEAIAQATSDLDLALALQGLGVFVTDAPAPVDPDTGDELPWRLAPAAVLELGKDGAKFERVSGVTNVDAPVSYVQYLEDGANKGASVPAVALGQVDVAGAESGIALYLKLSPLLAANAERETEMLGVYDQMLFDLRTMWFPAYESLQMPNALVTTRVGDPMPENVQQKIADLSSLVLNKIMSAQTARAQLTKYGFVFAANEADLIAQETSAGAAASLDGFSQRLNAEGAGAAGAAAADG